MSVKLRRTPAAAVCCCVLVAALGAAGAAEGGVKGLLDAAPTDRQKPYAPAHRQAVAVNPPPFIWVPAGKNATYALQLSRSKGFAGADTLTFDKLPTTVHVPPKPLAAGQWFWRYGVRTPGGAVYGKARPFTVPADAREFPFPNFSEVIARVPKRRPRLFFPGERLARIRKAAGAELKSALDSLCRRCERAIGRPIVAEPPRPKTGPERVVVMRTTRPPMDEMERCALAYLLTGRTKFGLEAKRRLMHFFSWNPNGPTGLWGYDEPAMWMMMRGTRAYDWTAELFTPAERKKIEPVLKVRAEQFHRHLKRRPFESDPYESHAGRMPGFLGEAALSFAHEWPEAKGWLEYATLLYCTSYPAWGGDDGGWQEGPGYWGAYMRFALHYVAALKAATGVDLMNKPFFRNTPYYALYTATPYHEHRPFGDGASGGPGGLGGVMYAFSTLGRDPYVRWAHSATRRGVGADVLTAATYDPSLRARSPRDLPPARHFPAVGLAAIHTALGEKDRDVTLLFRSSPFGSVSHGHADQNAFVVEAFGKALAPVTGYYPWYGSPHHHNWTRATRAVNSVLVDAAGQVRRSWRARGRITAFRSGGGYDYVEGEAAAAYGGRLKRFRRHVVHVRLEQDGPAGAVFVLFDDLVAAKAATFQWLLHAMDKIDVGGRVLRVRREPAAMDVHVLLPRKVRISQTDQYDPKPEKSFKGRPYADTWHLTAETTAPAATGRFLTVLVVRRTDAKAKPPTVALVEGAGAVGVRLAMPGGEAQLVAFRTDARAEKVSCGGLTSDARVFAEGRDTSGKMTRTLRIDRTE